MHELRPILAVGQRRRFPLAVSTLIGLAVLCGVARTAAAAPLPDRAWGTYYGGTFSDEIWAATSDAEGNVYVAGSTMSHTGIATPGTHKPNSSGEDGFLAKFSPDGSLLWGTYFAGAWVRVNAIAAAGGRVVLAGQTGALQGIATLGAFQATPADGDGFVMSFTAAGALEWGTYLGAAGFDMANGVALDAQGSAYVVGYSLEEVANLGTPGTHRPTPGGNMDPYIIKFDAQGQHVWGSYYGGAADSQFQSVAINELGELYVTGKALQQDDTLATADAHQPALAGYKPDGILVRFTLDGERMWGTYYGGQGIEDVLRPTALPQGGVVLVGGTDSVDGIASAGAFKAELDGIGDVFLARFDAAGTRLWGTYYGGNSLDTPKAIASDAAGAVYMCGLTFSSDGIVTENAFLTVPGPNHASSGQLFVAKFDDLGEQRWGSYFGGGPSSVKMCPGIAVDASYRVHVAGMTNSSAGFATPGTHQGANAGSIDGYIVQWDQGLGQPCAGAGDCGSGWCVDGMCCDTACGDGAADCQACSVAAGGTIDGVCTWLGPEVTCRAADGACDIAETCPGAGGTCPADGHAPDDEPCEDGLCSAGLCVPPDDTTTGGESTTDDASTGANDSTTGEDSTGANDSTSGEGSTNANDSTTGDLGTTGEHQGTSDETSGANDPGTGESAGSGDDLADGGTGCNLAGDPALGMLALPWWLARRRRHGRLTGAWGSAVARARSRDRRPWLL